MKYLFALCLSGCLSFTAWAGSYEDFFSSIHFDRSDTIQELLDRGFDPNTVNEKGIPALVLAMESKAWKCAMVLIQYKKIHLNSTNLNDENALMLAAIHNEADIAQLLVQKG
ncbi:MAG: ankyrin repeat domain-containing protein, partial [Limnohabitans sp.]